VPAGKVAEQGVAEGFDSAAFDRHMDKLRAQKELEKTDPMRALVNKMKSDDDYKQKSKSKPKQDSERQITDPFHPSQSVNIGEQGVAEGEKKGLYYYVNKRKKAGTSRPASSPKAPTAQAWKDAAKTAKKESVDPYFESLQSRVEKLTKK